MSRHSKPAAGSSGTVGVTCSQGHIHRRCGKSRIGFGRGTGPSTQDAQGLLFDELRGVCSLSFSHDLGVPGIRCCEGRTGDFWVAFGTSVQDTIRTEVSLGHGICSHTRLWTTWGQRVDGTQALSKTFLFLLSAMGCQLNPGPPNLNIASLRAASLRGPRTHCRTPWKPAPHQMTKRYQHSAQSPQAPDGRNDGSHRGRHVWPQSSACRLSSFK